MSKIRILYVYHVSQIGGGSYTLLNIIKELDKTKYEPIVLLRNQGPLVAELENAAARVLFLKDIRAIPYNKDLFQVSSIKAYLKIIQSLFRYHRIVRMVKPDIIHINSMMLYPYLFHFKRDNIKRIVHIRENWPKEEHVYQRAIAQKVIQTFSQHIFAINKHSAQLLKLQESKVTIVYDWINMKNRFAEMNFSDLIHEDCEGKKVYLFTGGFQSIKGIQQVVEAFSTIVKDKMSLLLILGDDKNELSNNKSLVKTASLIKGDHRIKIISATYNITHLLQQSYCVLSYFVIPHANLALPESIICQTPVIAAKTPESMEYSVNGEYAKLFKMNNYNEFCYIIEHIDGWHESLKNSLSKGARIVEKMFDTNDNSAKIEQIYEQLYKNKKEKNSGNC